MSIVYKSKRQLKKVEIPGLKGSEVLIYTNLLYGEIEQIYSSEKSDIAKATEALVVLVKDWNLTNEDGSKLPISVETFKTFDIADVTFLLEQTDFSEVGKKKVNLPEQG